MSEKNYQTNRDIVLNGEKEKYKNYQKEYYKKNIKLLRKNAREKYRSLPEDKKEAVRERALNRYHNMTDEEKKNIKIIKKNIEKT